jgi:catechol 2,3-dioxygenase-like lactoylglutathione lyase family enzyme
VRLHHVQVSCPAGGEEAARAFYGAALGLAEVDKPPVLAARGGCWFRGAAPAEDGGAAVEVHVGVEEPFRPAAGAHPALLVGPSELVALAARLETAGFPVRWDEGLPGYERFYTADGNGNRVELLALLTAD